MSNHRAAPGKGQRGIAEASSSVGGIEDVHQANSRAQVPRPSLEGDGIHIGCIWKSARDRSRAIDARLRQFNGYTFAELRMLEMDTSGRMQATRRGLSVSISQLGKLSKLVGDAYRRAEQLQLTPRSTS